MSDSNLTPLRKLRLVLGLDGKAVADACGLEQSTYSRMENDPDYVSSARRAQAIVDYFGGALSLDQVLFPRRHPDYLKNFERFRSSTGVNSSESR
jgi:transcriptional regulator with XRE-family HTH domain